jgi:acyl-CoA synthetase (AMP-forming)/AMP-acid ligase II
MAGTTEYPRFTTVSHALGYYAVARQSKVAMMHPKPSGAGYQALTFHELNQVTSRVASHYQAAFNRLGVMRNRNVALYANSSAEYILSLWALMKANFVPFCVSPRNSEAALSHLVQRADTFSVVCGKESNLAANVDSLMRERVISHVVEILTAEELQAMVDSVQAAGEKPIAPTTKEQGAAGGHQHGDRPPDPESVALRLHSSGSTGKCIITPHLTHRRHTSL